MEPRGHNPDDCNWEHDCKDIKDSLKALGDKLDALRTQDLPGVQVEVAGLKVRVSLWEKLVLSVINAVIGAIVGYFLH